MVWRYKYTWKIGKVFIVEAATSTHFVFHYSDYRANNSIKVNAIGM